MPPKIDNTKPYVATPEELFAIDVAERSGVASDDEVQAVFARFGMAGKSSVLRHPKKGNLPPSS